MHPTADTRVVIYLPRAARRVMRGVRQLQGGVVKGCQTREWEEVVVGYEMMVAPSKYPELARQAEEKLREIARRLNELEGTKAPPKWMVYTLGWGDTQQRTRRGWDTYQGSIALRAGGKFSPNQILFGCRGFNSIGTCFIIEMWWAENGAIRSVSQSVYDDFYDFFQRKLMGEQFYWLSETQ